MPDSSPYIRSEGGVLQAFLFSKKCYDLSMSFRRQGIYFTKRLAAGEMDQFFPSFSDRSFSFFKDSNPKRISSTVASERV